MYVRTWPNPTLAQGCAQLGHRHLGLASDVDAADERQPRRHDVVWVGSLDGAVPDGAGVDRQLGDHAFTDVAGAPRRSLCLRVLGRWAEGHVVAGGQLERPFAQRVAGELGDAEDLVRQLLLVDEAVLVEGEVVDRVELGEDETVREGVEVAHDDAGHAGGDLGQLDRPGVDVDEHVLGGQLRRRAACRAAGADRRDGDAAPRWRRADDDDTARLAGVGAVVRVGDRWDRGDDANGGRGDECGAESHGAVVWCVEIAALRRLSLTDLTAAP